MHAHSPIIFHLRIWMLCKFVMNNEYDVRDHLEEWIAADAQDTCMQNLLDDDGSHVIFQFRQNYSFMISIMNN